MLKNYVIAEVKFFNRYIRNVKDILAYNIVGV